MVGEEFAMVCNGLQWFAMELKAADQLLPKQIGVEERGAVAKVLG
jgi:hypothetical protein